MSTIEGALTGAYALGVRPAMRDAHAKGHGCVKAEFRVGEAPPELRVGVFAEARTYRAWIRFSNGAGTPHDDHAGDGRGMAIKLTGVPGRKLLDAEIDAQTQDFVMINHPVFFIRNVADYVPFTTLSLQGKSDQFLATHPHEQSIVAAIMAQTVDEMFEQRYFSMAPYRLGERYIKFSARPVDCSTNAPIEESTAAAPTDPDYLREAMISWLGEKDACFRFGVQLQTDPASQPIEDPTILWDETAAPFVDVASIRIPKQTFDSEAQQTFCENLSFTPWHALPEHRPVGGINRLRKAVYEAISDLRHRLNRAAPAEPTGDETFH
ncbi:catalase [Brevundimonas lenta]|uniref:Catalase n=1 Tax=Brevundimonas lenta TaxID=424796 RepID=A0A7W6NQ54_9CAUL|nr:catalase [Brevundimonas lenta]